MTLSTGPYSKLDWYLTNTLAIITGLVFCVGLVLNIAVLIIGDDLVRHQRGAQSIQAFDLLAMLVAICVFGFWIKMLNDYFRNRPEKRAVAWGWALFLLTAGAALAYFWFVWRWRARQRTADALELR